jgi:hypothetical protein
MLKWLCAFLIVNQKTSINFLSPEDCLIVDQCGEKINSRKRKSIMTHCKVSLLAGCFCGAIWSSILIVELFGPAY